MEALYPHIPRDRLEYVLAQQAIDNRVLADEREQQAARGVGPVRHRRPRRYWVRFDLTQDHRLRCSHYHTLLQLNLLDANCQQKKVFSNYTRMSMETFSHLMTLVRPMITKQDTRLRAPIDPGLKLACTLRYLATGDSFHSLGYAFSVSHNTVSLFVPQVCAALINTLKDEAFHAVTTADDWRAIAKRFEDKWNMPHCIGALDGKHFRMKKPAHSGSLYFNYKGYFSIPMLALVDADYRFLWLDAGGQGHMSDAQIFLQTDLHAAVVDNTINRPPPCPLTQHPEDTQDIPYFIVADDAFALKDYCMKPFSRRTMSDREKVFNYRLSRARRVVENAFGILAMRFRIFMRPIETRPDNALLSIKAAVTLHNVLRVKEPMPAHALDREDEDGTLHEGEWRQLVKWEDGPSNGLGRAGRTGMHIRDLLADYFGSPQGEVPWQWRMAGVRVPRGPANTANTTADTANTASATTATTSRADATDSVDVE
ncbi:hypothetical protein ACOMHN_051006 [Nucella lapillus]